VSIHDGVLTAKLPALSWNVLRLGSEPSTASRNTA
jgi:hypothetical protein